jgi:hypothetical protein
MPKPSRIPFATSLLTLATSLWVGFGTSTARADTVVQIPLPGLLDGRSVTTLTGGKLVVWTLPTDGGGLQNAFMTAAGATLQGAPPANALPDDGRFPADARHPEVVLHFSNDADPAAPQTHLVSATTSFSFAVPAATYSKLFLFFNGAAGGTLVTVTLTYADGMEMQTATIPDYYADVPATDLVIFNLATNLAKWDKNSKIAEANHHNITGAEFHPMAAKTLTNVQVERNAMGNLVFWGATGIATSAVASGGSGGSGAGGMSGAGGGLATGGAGGAGGTGEAAGGATSTTAGAAGANTSAGGTGNTAGGAAAAGAATAAGSSFTPLPTSTTSDSGCSCRLAPARSTAPRALWLLLGAASLVFGRRRRARNAPPTIHDALGPLRTLR